MDDTTMIIVGFIVAIAAMYAIQHRIDSRKRIRDITPLLPQMMSLGTPLDPIQRIEDSIERMQPLPADASEWAHGFRVQTVAQLNRQALRLAQDQ